MASNFMKSICKLGEGWILRLIRSKWGKHGYGVWFNLISVCKGRKSFFFVGTKEWKRESRKGGARGGEKWKSRGERALFEKMGEKWKALDWRLGFGILGTYHNLLCIKPEFKAVIAFDFNFEPMPSANTMLQRIVKLGLLM